MKINVDKTKVMCVGGEWKEVKATINGEKVEQVDEFKYLGSWIDSECKSSKDIKRRIGIAKEAFKRMQRILCGPLALDIRKRMAKCFIWSVFLYGAETWTMRSLDIKRIEAFEMWVWRRLERVKWTEKMKNEDVLKKVKEKRRLLREIKKRKANWIGHRIREKGLFADVLEGLVEGGRKRGRRRTKMTDDLKKGECYQDMKRRAHDRETWRKRWCSKDLL